MARRFQRIPCHHTRVVKFASDDKEEQESEEKKDTKNKKTLLGDDETENETKEDDGSLAVDVIVPAEACIRHILHGNIENTILKFSSSNTKYFVANNVFRG